MSDPVGYAICTAKITSPVADERGMTPNAECGMKIPIYIMGGHGVLAQCPMGHTNHVTELNYRRTTA